MQDKVNVTDYKTLSFIWAVVDLAPTPPLNKTTRAKNMNCKPSSLHCSPLHYVAEMKHLTPYRLNETSLSPVRGRGMGLLSEKAGRKGGLLVVVMPVGLWRIDNLIHQPTLCRNSSSDSSGNISTPSPRLICSLASSTRAKNSSLVRRVESTSFSETSFRKYLAARFSRFSSSAMILILRRISAFICIAVMSSNNYVFWLQRYKNNSK